MTDDALTMLQRDVERLEHRVAVIPKLEAQVEAMGREIGQIRTDLTSGMDRHEQHLIRISDATDAAREEARVWMSRFGWLIAASALGIVMTALVTRAFL